MSAVTRAEFDELKQAVEGEKVVSRYILEQTRRNGDDLAALRTRVTRIEDKVDGLERKVDLLDRQVRDLPAIIRDTMREVLSERDGSK